MSGPLGEVWPGTRTGPGLCLSAGTLQCEVSAPSWGLSHSCLDSPCPPTGWHNPASTLRKVPRASIRFQGGLRSHHQSLQAKSLDLSLSRCLGLGCCPPKVGKAALGS